jgi:hypothetical protein
MTPVQSGSLWRKSSTIGTPESHFRGSFAGIVSSEGGGSDPTQGGGNELLGTWLEGTCLR